MSNQLITPAVFKPGDKVTMTVDALYPRDHENFCAIAKVINAGAVGVVVETMPKAEAKRKLGFGEDALLVKFIGTAWADGVWSRASAVKVRRCAQAAK